MRNSSYVALLAISAFGSSSELTIKELVERFQHSRTTVFCWLKSLEGEGFLSSYCKTSGSGRPSLIFLKTPKFDSLLTLITSPQQGSLRLSDLVPVSFNRLRNACRFRENDECGLYGRVEICTRQHCELILR